MSRPNYTYIPTFEIKDKEYIAEKSSDNKIREISTSLRKYEGTNMHIVKILKEIRCNVRLTLTQDFAVSEVRYH